MSHCGAARDRGKLGDRRRAFKDDDIAAVGAIPRGPETPVSERTRRLTVPTATYCKRFPDGTGGI